MNHHAVHYCPPRPPVLFRFATVADRDAWIADYPGFRRAIAAPADTSGYMAGPVSITGGTVHAAFRIATIADLFQPVTALRDAMIDRLKEAAVSP